MCKYLGVMIVSFFFMLGYKVPFCKMLNSNATKTYLHVYDSGVVPYQYLRLAKYIINIAIYLYVRINVLNNEKDCGWIKTLYSQIVKYTFNK